MNKICQKLSHVVAIFAGILLAFSLSSTTAFAATTVSGNITTNTTWNAAGSPYSLTSTRYVQNAILTIDASAGPVVVNFPGNYGLIVQNGSSIVVNGTASNPVTFKHTSTVTTNAWDGVYVDSGATANINYAIFRYADTGLKCRGGTCSVSNSLFETNLTGIAVYDNSSLTTSTNTFNKQTYVPIAIEPENSGVNLGTGASADILGTSTNKNTYNAIGIGLESNSSTACIADICTIPQRTFAGISNIPYVVWNYYFDGANDTLQIDPGVILKFTAGDEIRTRNGAKVDINGASGNLVYFTSEKDDSVGGDTNNDGSATAPAAGNWSILWLTSGTNTIDYLQLAYSEYGITVENLNTSLTLSDSILQSNTYGVILSDNASLTTARNTFNKQTNAPIAIEPENNGVNLGTGASADILGTAANKNTYNGIALGVENETSTACIADICTIPQRTFAGISNIPYLAWDYFFDGSNDTLQIDPGVIIKMITGKSIHTRSGAKIDINGANGNMVYFTSDKDDTVGGDTNNDGTATTPIAGNWSDLTLSSGANTIDYLQLSYSSYGINVSALNTSLVLNDSILHTNSYGVMVTDNASLTTARNTFNKQTYVPLAIEPENNGVTLGTGASADILGTSTNKNGYNGIGFGVDNETSTACISNTCTIPQRTFAGISNIPYVAGDYFFDGADDTLQIDPGVIIKMMAGKNITNRNGSTLDINGTAGNNVYITSDRDDTLGGDTNNNSSANGPTAGNWASLSLSSTGANTIDFATIRYGTNGIYFNGPSITVNDSNISNNTTGLYFKHITSPTLARLNVENNGALTSGEYRWAAYNFNATTMLAQNLFWGSTDGPNDADATGSCGTNTSDANAVRDLAASPITFCPFSTTRFNSIANLSQYKSNGTTLLSVGDTTDEFSIILRSQVNSHSSTGTLNVDFEVRPLGTDFTNTSTHTSTVQYAGSPVTASTTISGLSNSTSYHWQSRVCNSLLVCSSWLAYGDNAESVADFQVSINLAPGDPSSLSQTNVADGSYLGVGTPGLRFTLTDPNTEDTLRYQIQVDDSANFSSPVVDYTSSLNAQGEQTFTVSQGAGSGTYTTGTEGQTLSDGAYYWRVRGVDNRTLAGNWTIANSGNVVFTVDATAPSIPGAPTAITPVTATPTWNWTASTDTGSGLLSTAYTVEWCASADFAGCGANTTTSSTNSFTHMTPLAEGTWYFRVKATDNIGNVSAYSDNGTISIDVIPPATNASNIIFQKTASGSTLASNDWTNSSSPYVSWSAGTDNSGGSGIKGYCLYLGTSSSGNPATSKGLLGTSPISTTGTTCEFIVSTTNIDFATLTNRGSTWLTSSTSPYYLNIKALDNGNNIFTGSSTQFQFRFDDTSPVNVGRLYVGSGSYSNVDDMSFGWPTTGSSEAAADNHSDILGFQYQLDTNPDIWIGTTTDAKTGIDYISLATQPFYLTQVRDGAHIRVGTNIISFRVIDQAGNYSAGSVTGVLSYGGAAPTFATSCNLSNGITVTPSTSTSNLFAFSWETATPSAGRSVSSYYYMVNTSPPSSLSTMTSNSSVYIPITGTSVSATSLTGINKGENTIYVVVKDDLDNYSAANCLKGTLTLNSTLPDPPSNLSVSDASVKEASLWRAALAWDAPDYKGSGSLHYTVQNSQDGNTWTTVTTTTGTAYIDTVPSSTKYYWRVGTYDTTSESAASPSFSSALTLTPKGKYTSAAGLTSGPTVSDTTTKRATISWVTSRTSDSKVQYGKSSGVYFTEEASISDQVTSHSIKLTNLSPSTTYYYKVKWTDEDGNNGTSEEKTFSTDPAPVISDVEAVNVGLNAANIKFTSEGATKVKIYYGKTENFGGVKELSISSTKSNYNISLSGLDDGTKYFYKINSFDSEDDEYQGTTLFFTTMPRPKIANVKLQEVVNTSQTTILVTWESNTEVSSIITYYPDGEPSKSRDEVKIDLVSGAHEMLLRGLLPNTKYRLVVRGQDKAGNEGSSDAQVFTTATDTRSPSVTNLRIFGGSTSSIGLTAGEIKVQIVVSWDTDEPSTSQVEFGEGTGTSYSQKSQEDSNLTNNHAVVLTNITPSQVYHLRVISRDHAGNLSQSPDAVTIAPKATQSASEVVLGIFSEVFGGLGGNK